MELPEPTWIERPASLAAPASVPAAAGAASDAAAQLAARLAALDPWHVPRWPTGPSLGMLRAIMPSRDLTYGQRLLTLPRQYPGDAELPAQLPAVAVGVVGTSAALLGSLLGYSRLVGFPLADPVLQAACSLLVFCATLGLPCITLAILPRLVYHRIQRGLLRLYDQTYRETFRQLSTTSLAALIADEAVWRAACERVAADHTLKVMRLGPPATVEEAVCLAAALWPYLVAYQQGDAEALVRGLRTRLTGLAGSGTTLIRPRISDQFRLRARAAAIVDFLLDLPDGQRER